MNPTILLFVQTGCPACEEFMKTFKPLADPYYNDGRLAIQVGDLAKNRRALGLANQYNIQYTPTMIGLRGRRIMGKLEGAAGADEVKKLLEGTAGR